MPRPRKQRGPKAPQGAQVYRRAYHVDLSRSMAQLMGWTPGDAATQGLRGRWTTAAQTSIGSLSVEQLVLLLTQGASPAALHVLWPAVLDHLEADLFATHGTSLIALVVGQKAFWLTHPHARAQLETLIAANRERLEEAADSSVASSAQRFARDSS